MIKQITYPAGDAFHAAQPTLVRSTATGRCCGPNCALHSTYVCSSCGQFFEFVHFHLHRRVCVGRLGDRA